MKLLLAVLVSVLAACANQKETQSKVCAQRISSPKWLVLQQGVDPLDYDFTTAGCCDYATNRFTQNTFSNCN